MFIQELYLLLNSVHMYLEIYQFHCSLKSQCFTKANIHVKICLAKLYQQYDTFIFIIL